MITRWIARSKAWPAMVLAAALLAACCAFAARPVFAAEGDAYTTTHPRLLFISAYAYDWDSVPDQLGGTAEVLGSKARLEYVFMNTKKFSYDEMKGRIADQITDMIATGGRFDGVLLEDDAALDFGLEYRDTLFADTPMVFMGVNTTEKANKAHEDPFITGVVECFPYGETIDLAEKLCPNATKIVGICDDSESGQGCAQRFYAEAATHPELAFSDINTSKLTEQEIADTVASYDDTTILMFLSLVEDKEGNLYSLLEATEFVAENAKIPMFKADQLGIGQGVFGGYVSSYREMARTAATQMQEIMAGTPAAEIPVTTMDGYPCFDQRMMDKFGIQKAQLPADSEIINYTPTFYEQYHAVIWPAFGIFAFLTLLCVFVVMMYRKQAALRLAKAKNEAQDAFLKMEESKNRELSAAILRVQKADRAKSDFLARMSHEIRTPMNAIIGETTLAQYATGNPAKMSEYLGQIQVSSRHLLGIINDVLDMSAIESDKIKLAHVDFDLKEVVSTVTTLYYAQCKAKGIDFVVHCKDVSTEFLVGDQLRLQQVVLNLLSNAYKFTEAGGRIEFSVAEEPQPDDHVLLHIKVRDTGCGMAPEYMTRIFTPFEQESSLTAKEHGGSGLGLSICKNLVELMGGQITVESELGKGSCFALAIPYCVANSQLRTLASAADMKVMLIDDDRENLEYTSGILNHIGIEHDDETDPDRAIEKMAKARNDGAPYTLCLVDWRMSPQDGVEVTRRIRKAQAESTVVIVLTAYDVNEISDDATAAGADACIAKPVFQSTLFDLMMRLSDGKLVEHSAKPVEFDFTGKRVLLVDDTEINREIAAELLQMVHFTVDTAVNGREAVDTFAAAAPGTYDVILMDVQMPVMNGFEATRAIRAMADDAEHPRPDAKTIPILAMTANAFVEDIAKSLEAGMNDHISKPIDTDLMYSLLHRHLQS